MHADTAVLESGQLDDGWSCDMCGHVDYGATVLQRSISNANARTATGKLHYTGWRKKPA